MISTENKVAYIGTETTITVVLNGQNRTIQVKSKSHYYDVIRALERFKLSAQTPMDLEMLETFLAPIKRIVVESDKRFELDTEGRRLYLAGTKVPIPAQLGDKIMDFLEHNLPVDPLVKFWESCLRNPHYVAVQELFDFLTENHLPITDDGGFLGYKKLNFVAGENRIDVPDEFEELIERNGVVSSLSGVLVTPGLRKKYLEFINVANNPLMVDVHSGTIKQKVGEVVRIERIKLHEEERRSECGYGLHIGAFSYAFSGNVRVLCKVFPEDVIACNEGQAKLRTCKYQIVSFVDGAKEVKELLVNFNQQQEDIANGVFEDDDYEDFENPFDVDDIAICVDESRPDYNITEGGEYRVLDSDGDQILAIDDEGNEEWMQSDFFSLTR